MIENPLHDELLKIDPTYERYLELLRYDNLCQEISRLSIDSILLISWFKSRGEAHPFNLPEYFARWGAANEALLSTQDAPIEVPDLPAADLDHIALYSPRHMQEILGAVTGIVDRMDEHDPGYFHRAILEQMHGLLERWVRIVCREYDRQLFNDPETADFVFDGRDRLEYAASAIAVMQLEKEGRLAGIDAQAYFRALKETDEWLRALLRHAKRDDWYQPDLLAPETFWWRSASTKATRSA